MPIVLLLYSFIVLANLFLISYFSYININFYINLYLQNNITDQLKTCTHGACNCTIQSFITGPYSRIIISLLFIHHILWAMKESVKSNWQHHQKTKPSIYSQEMWAIINDGSFWFFFLELCYSSKVYVILINYFYDFPLMRLKFWNDWRKWFSTWVSF